MKVQSIIINYEGEKPSVDVNVLDANGASTRYRFEGEVSTLLNTSGSGYLNAGISVSPTRKRDNADRNIPSIRFNK